MQKGQRVVIKNTNSIWDGKEGILEEVDEDRATVFVNFIPEQQKRVRQIFNIDNLDFGNYNDGSEENTMNEDLKKNLNEDNEEYNDDTQRIIHALMNYFNVDEDAIEVSSWGSGHNFIVDGDEYWVGSYDEAWDAAVEDARNALDDMGLEALSPNYRDYVVLNFVNTSEIEDWMRESYYYYVNDIENESSTDFENRLIEEMYDASVLTNEDFEIGEDGEPDFLTLKDSVDIDAKKDDFLDYLCDNEDAMDWLQSIYSGSELSKVLEDNNVIDFDAIAEDCVETDGVAHFLASYDGIEHELEDDLYAYRID